MTPWTNDELTRIGTAEELDIASLQADGTLGKPTTIWVVRVGDDLYVRPVNGRSGAWFRGTQVRHEGHINAGGVDKDVNFVDVDADDTLNAQIDAAYWGKYPQYPQYVPPVVTPKARAATLKLVPR
jgi:hypothetical protein